jgi:3-oxoacyl-[acyl-carrier protein] reductase
MDLGIAGRTALVCASTAGLGRATAEALAAEGARVVISGRRADVAERIAAGLPGAAAVPCDITAPGAAARLVDEAMAALGAPIDIAVLNGPGPRPAAAQDISADDIRAAVETLLVFQQQLVDQVLPGMRQRGWGRVVAIGSSSVLEPIEGLALSTVGRSALAAYLKALATEVAADGVTVNMVLPGRIDTDRVRSLDASRAERHGSTSQRVAEENAAVIPARRYGTPAEFGAVATCLCSAQAGYVSGTAMRCDGGVVHHL